VVLRDVLIAGPSHSIVRGESTLFGVRTVFLGLGRNGSQASRLNSDWEGMVVAWGRICHGGFG
jgi:hypothetical protein